MVRLTQWDPTPKISAAMMVPFSNTSSRSAPPSRSGRVSDGWIGARRGSSIGLSHGLPTFVPPFFAVVLASKCRLEKRCTFAACYDDPREVLQAATASGETQHGD